MDVISIICQYLYTLVWMATLSTVCLSYGLHGLTANQSKIDAYLKAQVNLTERLLDGYDKRFIPAIPDEPLEVKLEIKISDVLRLDDQEMECELIIYIRQEWIDYRLSWNKSYFTDPKITSVPMKRIKIREHFLDKLWLPDIRISNLKEMNHFEKFGGINMNIHPNGRVYYSQLALVKIHCPMDLRNFPMDQQTCFLNFSSYAYSKSLLTFVLKQKNIEVDGVNQLPHFDCVHAKEVVVEDQATRKVSRVSIGLMFKRRSGHYFLQIYIPSLSLVILSWLAFLLNPCDVANRLALVTSTLLSIVFLHSEMNTSLPPVSYAKASDWFVLVSFVFTLLALLESSLVYKISTLETNTRSSSMMLDNLQDVLPSFLAQTKTRKLSVAEEKEEESYGLNLEANHPKKRHRALSKIIDMFSIFLFPAMYCGFNVFYWFYYT